MRCAIYKDVTLAANGGHSSTAKHSATSSFLAPRLSQLIPQNPHLCVKRNRPILNPTSQYTATNPTSIAILTRASISYSLSKPTRTPMPSRPWPTTSPKVLLAHLESLRKPIMHRVFPGPSPVTYYGSITATQYRSNHCASTNTANQRNTPLSPPILPRSLLPPVILPWAILPPVIVPPA